MKKKHPVVILPTEDKSHIYLVHKTNRLGYVTGKYPEDLKQFPQTVEETRNQHLYILSDDEIKEGDWVLFKYGDNPNTAEDVLQCIKTKGEYLYHKDGNTGLDMCKKIIATTDKSLYTTIGEYYNAYNKELPQIPESFIKEFVKSNGKIDEVEVEYRVTNMFTTLKLTPNNEVIISTIEEKMYSREEVVGSINEFFRWCTDLRSEDEVKEWIEDNL